MTTTSRGEGFRHGTPLLRERRKALGGSLAALAGEAAVDFSTLACAERQEKRLSPSAQAAIAASLGMPVDDLFVDLGTKPRLKDEATRQRLLAEAGPCGSPACQDADCAIVPGLCHRDGCTTPASVAPMTQAARRRVVGFPALFCSRACYLEARKHRYDRLHAAGYLTIPEAAKILDRDPATLLRHFVGRLRDGQMVGRRFPIIGAPGEAWALTHEELDTIRKWIAASPMASLHEDPEYHARHYAAIHAHRGGPKSKKMWGRKAQVLAARKDLNVGRKSMLTDEQKAEIQRLRTEPRRHQRSIREIAAILSSNGPPVTKSQVGRFLQAEAKRKKLLSPNPSS